MSVKERNADGEETGERRVSFRTVFVFDISQTEVLAGREPVPLAVPREALTGDSHAELLGPLKRLAGELGYEVRYRPLAGPDEVCDYHRRRISIDQDLAANAKVATLVHELGHVLVESEPTDGQGLTKELEELVVEAVAYIALQGPGSTRAAIRFPTSPAGRATTRSSNCGGAAQLIDALARRIEQAIDAEREPATA